MRRCSLLVILLLLLLALPAPADELVQNRSALEQVRQRIEQTLDNLSQKKEAATVLSADLAKLDRALRRADRQRAGLEQDVNELQKRERAAEQAADENRQRLQKMQKAVERRLVALYREGEMGLLQVLFSRSKPSEMSWQYEYLTRILHHDRDLLGRYRKEQQARQRLLDELTSLRQQRQQRLAQLAEQQRLLRDGRATKKRLLARAHKDQHLLQGLLARLEAQAGELQGLVKRLESQNSREYTQVHGAFAAEKGRLSWPVTGTVLVGFGRHRHPELGTPFDNRGLELKVPVDVPVHSVWSGRVVFADWFSGYGNLLIVDHGDGYHTLYARLGSLSKRRGDLVEKGETIGVTDDATGRLYFEIRSQGTPVDPQPWLGSSP